MIRENFITIQYIWVLENEQIFVTKAQHKVERGNFLEFAIYVQYYTRDFRHEHNDVLSAAEWAYLYIELWHRMGGYQPNYGWHFEDIDCYQQQKRVLSKHETAPTNPCVLASEPEKEEPMSNTVEIKTITYINNVDVTKMSDEQLIDAIKTIENEMAALKAVKTKSTKITIKINEALHTLSKVVAILDGR